MYEIHGLARTATYIREDLKHRRRKDLEVMGEPVIWISVHPKNQKPILILNFYRQCQIVTDNGKIINTNSQNHN